MSTKFLKLEKKQEQYASDKAVTGIYSVTYMSTIGRAERTIQISDWNKISVMFQHVSAETYTGKTNTYEIDITNDSKFVLVETIQDFTINDSVQLFVGDGFKKNYDTLAVIYHDNINTRLKGILGNDSLYHYLDQISPKDNLDLVM